MDSPSVKRKRNSTGGDSIKQEEKLRKTDTKITDYMNIVKTKENMADKHDTENENSDTEGLYVENLDSNAKDYSMQAIGLSLQQLHKKFDGLKLDIHEPKEGLKARMVKAEDCLGECSGCNDELYENSKALKQEVHMLKSVVIHQNEQLKALQSQVLDLTTRSMKNNVLFHNIPEVTRQGNKEGTYGSENTEEVINNFMKNEMAIEGVEFENIHRVGPRRPGAKVPRLICAKMHTYKDVVKILQKGRNLETGTGKPKVTPQYPAEQLEKRRQLREQAEDAKRKHPDASVYVGFDKVYVNNSPMKQKVPKPELQKVLSPTNDDLSEEYDINLYEGKPSHERGSTFTACAARIKSINEARAAYAKLLRDPVKLRATHNMAAYRLYSPENTKVQDGFEDDGEHGGGRSILKTIMKAGEKDIIVFVTRQYGGQHLGLRRFDLINEAVTNAMAVLKQDEANY